MTLGQTTCAALGCSRRRHVTAEGRAIYTFCWAHVQKYLRAFAA